MAWYNEKFECPNPPDCAANQMVPPSEWNAMVAYLKDKIRGMPFTAPGAGDDGKYIKYVHGTPGFVLDTPAGGGDMLKSVYDIGDNGIVDNSEKVDGCDAGIATGNVFKIPAGIAQGDIFYVDASGNIVRLAAGTNGHFLKTQGAAANPIWAAGVGGVNTWLELTDTPSAFTGQAGKYPKVNAGETALEFGTPSGEGDVVGPASSVNNRIVLFDGVTGKLIKDAGKLLSNTANNIPVLDASADLPLAQIPATLTGKDADTVDGIEGAEIFKKDGSVAATGDFLPDTTGIRKLGSTLKHWGDMHSDNHYIHNVLYGGFKVAQDLLPNVTETHLLGSATYKWDIIWARTVDFNSVCTDLMNRMSAGDYINFTDGIEFNGAAGRSIINITHLLPKTTGASDLGSSTLKFRKVYVGDIIAWDGLSGGIKCEQDWLPFTTNTYDLGSASYYWENLFLNGYIDLLGSLYVDTIAERTAGVGVTIDACLIKDGLATAPISSTLTVAANDAKNKPRSDYQCDASADQTEINNAINALPI